MLRRPPTAIMLTVDDIAAYEDRKAQAAYSRADAARSFTTESSQESKLDPPEPKRANSQGQSQALMTPEAQSQTGNPTNAADESMLVDTDEVEDSLVFQGNAQHQRSVFTPPNAPVRGGQAQARQRSRNERIGINR